MHSDPETVRRRVKDENLPAQKDGRLWKFYPPEVADWLEQRAVKQNMNLLGQHH
jgi:hypothetical protein